jgi:hypothetical protein
MLSDIFDREGMAVSFLAMVNLSFDKLTAFLAELSTMTHFLMDVGQILVAFATAAYFIVKTLGAWKKWRKQKYEKSAGDPTGPSPDGVRDADPEES